MIKQSIYIIGGKKASKINAFTTSLVVQVASVKNKKNIKRWVIDCITWFEDAVRSSAKKRLANRPRPLMPLIYSHVRQLADFSLSV